MIARDYDNLMIVFVLLVGIGAVVAAVAGALPTEAAAFAAVACAALAWVFLRSRHVAPAPDDPTSERPGHTP